ncbi:MAG: hypothetical protein ACFFC7_20435 [Candidatus Hermodarchaeota archaeon]
MTILRSSLIKRTLLAIELIILFVYCISPFLTLDTQLTHPLTLKMDVPAYSNNLVHALYTNALKYPIHSIWGGPSYDAGHDITLDGNGHIYTVGTTTTYSYQFDLCLLKWNTAGNLLWNRTFGKSEGSEEGFGIAVTTNGSYIYTCGYVKADTEYNRKQPLVVKWDEKGNMIWTRTWNMSADAYLQDIVLGGDGSIYTVTQQLLLMKWDSKGNILWNSTWNGSSWDHGMRLTIDPEDNIYAIGYTRIDDCTSLLLIKWNSNGTILWNRTWSEIEKRIDNLGIDLAYSDGSIYTIGRRGHRKVHYSSSLIMRWDSKGNILWNKTGSGFLGGSTIAASDRGNIYTVGYAQSEITTKTKGMPSMGDIALAKWDSSGNQTGIKIWSASVWWDYGNAMVIDNNEKIYCVGGANASDIAFFAPQTDLLFVIFSATDFSPVPQSSGLRFPLVETLALVFWASIGGMWVVLIYWFKGSSTNRKKK